jgi:hypothetical protein
MLDQETVVFVDDIVYVNIAFVLWFGNCYWLLRKRGDKLPVIIALHKDAYACAVEKPESHWECPAIAETGEQLKSGLTLCNLFVEFVKRIQKRQVVHVSAPA